MRVFFYLVALTSHRSPHIYVVEPCLMVTVLDVMLLVGQINAADFKLSMNHSSDIMIPHNQVCPI